MTVGEEQTQVRRRAPWVLALVTVGVIAALLGTIAGLGGFRTVAMTGPVTADVGQDVNAALMTVTVDRIAVMDQLEASGVFPDEEAGERVLAVMLTVTNHDDEPRAAWRTASLDDYRLEHRPDDAPSVKVLGDVGFNVTELQPGVPTTVVLSWALPAGELAAGDTISVIIPDATKGEVGAISGSVLWDELPPAAIVTGVPEDLGTGEGEGEW